MPVIVSGGLDSADEARRAYRESAADAVMIARGALGNPWIFEQLSGRRAGTSGGSPTRSEIVDELLWTMERAEEHLGARRAARYARKFYPWYLERLGIRGRERPRLPAHREPRPGEGAARLAGRAAGDRRLRARAPTERPSISSL